ncbi:DUF4232 domain-containing protein [Catellatospora tritici]|uniref:DUF4232 domain-containing protein n=1 Tax=Catellatospora tritici TaxID=2851566 RepID=UPI001C2CC9CB|nr:DUF4232 domain-containing protein [Catellatospora tritici]MBV1851791.1 DUF4232 domain-containing protein [Catellatospora tritici]
MRRLAVLSTLLLLTGCAAGPPTAKSTDSAAPVVPRIATPADSPAPTDAATTTSDGASPAPLTGSWPPDAVPWQLNGVQGPEREVEQPRPVARGCTAADLPATAALAAEDGTTATELHHIDVRNAGASRCSLGGVPVLLSAGRTVPTVIDPPEVTGGGPQERPATIDPGESARFILGSSVSCGGGDGRSYRDISVRLADRDLRIPGLTLTSSCPIHVTGVFRILRDQPAHPHFNHLTARVTAPARVKAGANLDYTVTLTNPGRTDVVLDPCPAYQETLSEVLEIYLLNCAPGTIPAGGSIRFAMRLTIPENTPAQRWQLRWTIREWRSDAPAATATVTVY